MSNLPATVDYVASRAEQAPEPEEDSFVPANRIAGGSTSELHSETRDLLQWRLRAASIMLAIGFAAFLVRDLFLPRYWDDLFYLHALILVIQLANVVTLSGQRLPSMKQLRGLELLAFGVAVAYFALGQYVDMREQVLEDSPIRLVASVKSSILGILLLVLTYGIFIPNDWKRAARVVVPMAMAPLLAPMLLGLTTPEFRAVAERAVSFEHVSEHTLMLVLGAVTAIYGTHTINTFRTEAFQARRLNQYCLGRKLGSGGMGEVYLAEHHLLKRPCAIKLIRANLTQNPRVLARFEREVRTTAKLSHWNTIAIYDYGCTEDGTLYYVMEYLPGASLQDLVERHGPLPPARVIYLLRQACYGLHEAHQAGLVHRDLKPPNIFAAYRGGLYDVAKVLDFGLVKTLRDDQSPALTREGMVTGSPLYMAPEQIVRIQPPDARTDLYSLGAVAYFLLTGRPPFEGKESMAVMIAHARDPVIPPSRLRPDIPSDLEQVVLRCLEKDPRLRYQSAEELARALDACEDAGRWSPAQAADWWRRNEPSLEEAEGTCSTGGIQHASVLTDRVTAFPGREDALGTGQAGDSDRLDLSVTIGEDHTRPN